MCFARPAACCVSCTSYSLSYDFCFLQQFVQQELTKYGIVVEELGGDVQSVNISGLTGENVDKLEESVLLLAEMMELRAPDVSCQMKDGSQSTWSKLSDE